LIFIPAKITVYGSNEKEWVLITEKSLDNLTENLVIKQTSIEINNKNLGTFNSIKCDRQSIRTTCLANRKGKKPMVMIDEIELYNK
jgi:hypothetical protein